MNNFLRNLTATQQVGALFLVMFGILSIVTAWAFVRNLCEHACRPRSVKDRQRKFKQNWPLALYHQALAAIKY